MEGKLTTLNTADLDWNWRRVFWVSLVLCGCQVAMVTPDTRVEKVPAAGEMSELCSNQTQQLQQALRDRQDWALRMRDSNGRPGAGVLRHRLLWLGSFDQCLTTATPPSPKVPQDYEWFAHYCLATITLTQFRWEVTRVGFCFPEGCDGADVKTYLEHNGGFLGLEELRLSVATVNDVVCQGRDVKWSSATVAILVVLCIVGAVVGFCSVYHVLVADRQHSGKGQGQGQGKKKESGPSDLARLLRDESASSNVSEYTMLLGRPLTPRPSTTSRMRKLMTCFSLKSSWLRLIQTARGQGQGEGQGQGQDERSADALSCLHGLRVLCMLWVILGHTYLFAAKVPSSNLTEAWDRQKGGVFFQVVLNSFLAGDTFFLISGVLACYAFFDDMEDSGVRGTLLRFYCRKLCRITPVYLLVVLLMMFVVPHLGDGPLWSEMTSYTDQCRSHWWTNLLYVNNFVHTDRTCMEWTWYLANYMQFSALAPIFILSLHFVPAIGIFLCCTVVVLSSTLTGFIATHYKLGLNSHDLSQLSSQAFMEHYFTKPFCRAPPYFLGLLAGGLLYRAQCQMEINKVVATFISLILGPCALCVLYGTVGVANGAYISQPAASFYIAMSHVVWALGVAWFVVLCCTGNASWICRLLSWPCGVALSRLSLCVYLTHPLVILLTYLTARTPLVITPFTMTFYFCGSTVLSYAVALVLHLGFHSPVMALQQLAG